MKGQSMDIVSKILPAIVVGMLLIVGLLLVSNFDNVTRSNDAFIKGPVSNENLGTGPGNYTTANSPIATEEPVTLVTNATAGNITVTDVDAGNVEVTDIGAADDANITYSYLGGGAWDSADQTLNNSYSGFDLGSILPLVIFAAVIISILIAAFVKL